MTQTCKIAIAGLGVVGGGVIELIERRHTAIAADCGIAIEIVGISAKNRTAKRPFDPDRYQWYDNAVQMVQQSYPDILIEAIGGTEGIALDAWTQAIENHCHIVTANKALLAVKGLHLARQAQKNGVMIAYEAAVAGGIPIINCLSNAMWANNITAVQGILNGTCNYILSKMSETEQDFQTALKDAQEKGFAEADPHFDVDGIDAAHKLTILASLVFAEQPDFDGIDIQGIRDISPLDIRFAREMGYVLKLISTVRLHDNGTIAKTVMPAMVARDDPLAHISGVQNAVAIHSDALGCIMLEGPGAGAHATASAIIADIVNVARVKDNAANPVFLRKDLHRPKACDKTMQYNQFYLRMNVDDKPGVVASISSVMARHNVSIANVTQHSRSAKMPES
ncbi:MAG: homoserine dehydrogenase [Pseudomonadota bacterium]